MENKIYTEEELIDAIKEICQLHIIVPFFIQAVDRAVNDLVGDDKYKYARHYGMFLNFQSDYIIENIIPNLKSEINKFIPQVIRDIELNRLFTNIEKDNNGK